LLTYSIAFDDQTSTFIIPSGAGFEVVFCPGARSTRILEISRDEMLQLAQSGRVDRQTAMSLKRSREDMVRRNAATGTVRTDSTILGGVFFMAAMASFFQ
jgi:hypothetical protein